MLGEAVDCVAVLYSVLAVCSVLAPDKVVMNVDKFGEHFAVMFYINLLRLHPKLHPSRRTEN